VRLSAMYFICAIIFAALVSIVWTYRDAPASRKAVATKSAILLAAALITHLSAGFWRPSAYEELGFVSDPPWHRAFIGLGVHPDWPFGNLAAEYDCQPELPKGLSRGVTDSNGHCVYVAAVKAGAEPGPTYGAQYEKLVRRAFFHVAFEYPRKMLETYLLYKLLWVFKALSASTNFSVSREDAAPIMLALAAQLAILLVMTSPAAGDAGRLGRTCGAFALLAGFSLVPQLVAWSTIPTAPDLICYMFVGIAALLAAAMRLSLSRWFSPALR